MKKSELKQIIKEVVTENMHDDWYVKEKGDRMQQAPSKKEAAKLLWGWIKSDRNMDFQKFFALIGRLAAWTGLPMMSKPLNESIIKEAFTIKDDHKKFANQVIDSMLNKIRGREMTLQDLESMRTILKFKLAQEGWSKGGGQPPSEADIRRWDKERFPQDNDRIPQ